VSNIGVWISLAIRYDGGMGLYVGGWGGADGLRKVVKGCFLAPKKGGPVGIGGKRTGRAT